MTSPYDASVDRPDRQQQKTGGYAVVAVLAILGIVVLATGLWEGVIPLVGAALIAFRVATGRAYK
jgi:hypothetical protein